MFPAVFAIFIHFSGDRACIKDYVFIDPACGTSGFLVSAGEYLKENRKEEIFFNRQKKDHYMNHMFFGYDMDRTMLRIGAMNMMTHGIDNPFIEYRDSLTILLKKLSNRMMTLFVHLARVSDHRCVAQRPDCAPSGHPIIEAFC